MDCVVLAGGIPGPANPLFTQTQGKPKALLRIGQATMLELVVEALIDANSVQNIVVVGIENIESMRLRYPIDFVPNRGSMIANASAGTEWLIQSNPDASHALFCTSDIPTVTGPIIDRFVASCLPLDCAAYYSMVTREVMEERFPQSGRTFVNLGNVHLAGGDLVVARPDLADSNREILQLIASGRKQAWKLARIVGPSTLLKFLLHRLTISDIETRAQKVLDQPVKVIVSPDAELAMDVDNPDHLALLRHYLGDSGIICH
jgi:CTP:molybdopterin cytidylyltransferase MocA